MLKKLNFSFDKTKRGKIKFTRNLFDDKLDELNFYQNNIYDSQKSIQLSPYKMHIDDDEEEKLWAE